MHSVSECILPNLYFVHSLYLLLLLNVMLLSKEDMPEQCLQFYAIRYASDLLSPAGIRCMPPRRYVGSPDAPGQRVLLNPAEPRPPRDMQTDWYNHTWRVHVLRVARPDGPPLYRRVGQIQYISRPTAGCILIQASRLLVTQYSNIKMR